MLPADNCKRPTVYRKFQLYIYIYKYEYNKTTETDRGHFFIHYNKLRKLYKLTTSISPLIKQNNEKYN